MFLLQSNVKTFDFQIFQNGQNPAGKLDFLKVFSITSTDQPASETILEEYFCIRYFPSQTVIFDCLLQGYVSGSTFLSF